jgi:hypothetical protein
MGFIRAILSGRPMLGLGLVIALGYKVRFRIRVRTIVSFRPRSGLL